MTLGFLLSAEVYWITFYLFFAAAFIVFFILLFSGIRAPYGKFASNNWGKASINAAAGWMLMEGFSSLIFVVYLVRAFFSGSLTAAALAFFLVWQFHYAYRSFVYPLITPHGKKMPLAVMFAGMLFQIFNSLFQVRWIFEFAVNRYGAGYVRSLAFIAGLMLFLLGSFINRRADFVLRSLRKQGGSQYCIPCGGLFNLVSCPNYLGELIIWLGWAVMLRSVVGFAFFVWTAANLLPRALSSHSWYRETFADYPAARKALIPFIL